MARIIDADNTVRTLCNYYCGCERDECRCVEPCEAVAFIEKAPTISHDEVRDVGKWDRVETEFGLRCPKCGKLLDEYVNGGEWVALSEIPNYCPNCGAKMEVSE